MKNFNYWQQQHESNSLVEFTTDELGLLWLKTKSIVRKELLSEFLSANDLTLTQTKASEQFVELYNRFAATPSVSHAQLDSFIRQKYQLEIINLNIEALVSELYKLRHFNWGGDYRNSLDKYLVSRYIKNYTSYDDLMDKLKSEIQFAVQGYVMNSWYNHWTSILIEHIIKTRPSVLPTVGQIKNVDFFINNIPFDLKVTYLPAEYIKAKRKEMGLPVELTYLKKVAKELAIHFNKDNSDGDIQHEIIEKLRDSKSETAKKVLVELKQTKMTILKDAQTHPKALAKWLYENQGEMRFGSENRLFLILVDTEDFDNSWKLKRNLDLLRPAIHQHLDDFSKNLNDLRIDFTFQERSQVYSTFSDVLFIVK
jgi:hypothetical protein